MITMGEQLLYLEFWKPVLLGFFTVIGFGLYCWKKSDEYKVREKEMFHIPTKNITNHYHFYGENSKEQAASLFQQSAPVALPNTVPSLATKAAQEEAVPVILEANNVESESNPTKIPTTSQQTEKEIIIEPQKIDVNELILKQTPASKEIKEQRAVVDVSNDSQVTALYERLLQGEEPEETNEIQAVDEGAHSPITENKVEIQANEGMKVEDKSIEPEDPFKTDYVMMTPEEEAFFNTLGQRIFPDQEESSNWWGINPERLAEIMDDKSLTLTISQLDQQKEDYVSDSSSVLVVGKVTGHHQKDGQYAIRFSDPQLTKWVEVNQTVYQQPVQSILLIHIFRRKGEGCFTYHLNTSLEYYVLHDPSKKEQRGVI